MAIGRRAALLAATAALACAPPAPRPPDVLLVVLDTVRADRLSCYGHPRPTSPHLDALAARGIRFARASSTSSWTLPAHASLFTGHYPIVHGATQEHTRLDERLPTLAEQLSARGYQTFAATANPLVNPPSGLLRGFDARVETWRTPPGSGPHPNLAAVRSFLAQRDPDRPFFVFVNYFEAHAPYPAPEPHLSRFVAPAARARAERAARRATAAYYLDPRGIDPAERAALGDRYDAAVAHVDAQLGALLAELEARGALERALVFVTSDHGEHLGERGHFRHVFSLSTAAVRVPLIARLPGDARAGEVVEQPVSLLDLHATIAIRAGAAPAGRGRDLLALDAADAAPVFAEYYYPLQALGIFPDPARAARGPLSPHLRRLRSVERDGHRLIWSSDGRHELFDVRADPAEERDLAGTPALGERERALHGLLREFVDAADGERPLPDAARAAAGPGGAFENLDEQAAARLRALGYLRPAERGVE